MDVERRGAMRRNVLIQWGAITLLLCVLGCSGPTEPAAAKGEDEVRQTFVGFQEALKAKNAEKIWSLLDDDSQADAEREAKSIRDAYDKAAPGERAELEKALGLTGTELAGLKGVGFLKTRRFLGKYDEVPESKIEKIEVKGDKGVVHYLEPDGDKEKFDLVRQTGKWKLNVRMPKGR
jgi:hypothetical protein